MSEAEGRERTDSSSSVPANEEDAPQGKEVVTTSLFPVKVDKEALRKVAAAKRTNEDSLGSARERYLARKKAKLTAPVISDD